jgi:hypothetical protein
LGRWNAGSVVAIVPEKVPSGWNGHAVLEGVLVIVRVAVGVLVGPPAVEVAVAVLVEVGVLVGVLVGSGQPVNPCSERV